jgi:hypothetical protein
MTARPRHISGKGILYDGGARILEVSYKVGLEPAGAVNGDKRKDHAGKFSINITSSPDYDIYPYIGRTLMLRLDDGKLISGAIIDMNGLFLARRGYLSGWGFQQITVE